MQRIPPRGRLLLVLAVGLIVRLALAGNAGFSIDVGDFQSWAMSMVHGDPTTFYTGAGFADYPPGYLYVLWLVGNAYALLAPDGNPVLFLYLVKIPAILADLCDAVLIYAIVRRYADDLWALGAAALVALNPAIIFVSAAWGQIDSVTAGLALLGVYLMIRAGDGDDHENRYIVGAWVALAASVLMKPQAAVLAPLFIAFAFTSRERTRDRLVATLAGIVAALALGFVASWPFHHSDNPVDVLAWLAHIYVAGYAGYSYNSVNAFNLWTVNFRGAFWQSDSLNVLGLTQHAWGWLLFLGVSALTLWRYLIARTATSFLEAASIISLAFFMLMTRMHERYVFDALLLLIAAVAVARRYLVATIVVSVTLFANLAYSIQYLAAVTGKLPGANAQDLWGFGDHALSLLNVATFFVLAYLYFAGDEVLAGLTLPAFSRPASPATPQVAVDTEQGTRGLLWPLDYIVGGAITLGSFVLLFINYWFPADKIFDEIYFARAAEEYLTRNYIYESTHPPTTKLLITLSTMMFGGMAHGDNSWGWRFLNVVAGALVVWVLYIFAKRITGSTLFAGCAALLLAVDGQHFVQSRIATPEAFVALFSLTAIYTFYRFWLASQDRGTPVIDRRVVLSRIAGVATSIALAIGVVALHFLDEAFGAKIVVAVYFATGFYLVYRVFVEPRLLYRKALPEWHPADLWLGLFAISAALLVTSKWYGVMAYGLAIVVVLGVRLQAYFGDDAKTWGNPLGFRLDVIFCAVLFALGSIYALAYTPHFFGLKDQPTWPPKSYSVTDVVDMQVGAFEYHDHLKATHPYQSVWWQWPLDIRPVMYYANYTGAGDTALAGVIYSLPNPILLWFGLFAVPFVGWRAWVEKNKGYALIVIAYLAQWLPWIYSPRIAWNYHFYVNVALICLCNAIVVQKAWQRGWKFPAAAYVAVAVLAFVFFYPVLSGVPEPNWAWGMRQWLHSWV